MCMETGKRHVSAVIERCCTLLLMVVLVGCQSPSQNAILETEERIVPVSTEIALPDPQPWPSVACTLEELNRLRAAYRGTGPAHDEVARQVERADRALSREIAFPPEGGQHNQWYQCDKCQIGLETIDDTHHKCANCGEVYSGYPYDNVIFERQHYRLTRVMNSCAWAYAVTEDKKYAQHARDILMGYAERYTQYEYHSANMGKKTDKPSRSGGHVFEQTLNEASWAESVCETYDLIRLSPVVSEADRQAIRDGLLMPLYHNIVKHHAGKSNWQTYHNSAFMLIGGVLNDVDLVRQAIEDKKNGFFYQMKVSVLPEGMWYENSWGYHFYTLGAVERIVETARRLGIDLYQTPEVKKMYTVAMDYLMPDGSLPRFGDATGGGIPGRRYESAYAYWRDERFLAVLSEGPTWSSILYGRTEVPKRKGIGLKSSLKEGAGHAILRADGPEGASGVVMTFGPFGGFHGHFDKLSFVYFALDEEQGFDPGRARSQAYRLPVHRNWYRATTSHNAVLVDRTSQEGVSAHLELFMATDDLAAAAARVDEAYDGIVHHRLMVLRPGFLVVADVLNGTDGRDHTFDWLYHNVGESISSDQASEEGQIPEGQGFEYIQSARIGKTDGLVRTVIGNRGDQIHVFVSGASESEVLTGTGVGGSVLDRVPVLMVSRKGPSARFAAVFDPAKGDAPSEVVDVTVEDLSSGILVGVKLADGVSEYFAYDPAGVKRTVLGVGTDAKLLCLRSDRDGSLKVVAKK